MAEPAPFLAHALRGRVWKLGDSVDTNQLLGSGPPIVADPQENLRASCLRGVRPGFSAEVVAGDIIVAGTHFGCGSHRQGAVEALQACGIAAVLAESVARLHMRNSIARALPTFAVPGIAAAVRDGDRLEIDYPAGRIVNLATGDRLPLPRLPAGVENIYAAGGLLALLAERLGAEGIVPGE